MLVMAQSRISGHSLAEDQRRADYVAILPKNQTTLWRDRTGPTSAIILFRAQDGKI